MKIYVCSMCHRWNNALAAPSETWADNSTVPPREVTYCLCPGCIEDKDRTAEEDLLARM